MKTSQPSWTARQIKQIERYDLPHLDRTAVLNLDLNENPMDMPQAMRDALILYSTGANLNEYPRRTEQDDALKKAISDYVGVEAGNVLVTAGSDEALRTCFTTFCDTSTVCLFHSPSYAYAHRWVLCTGAKLVPAELSADDQHPAQIFHKLLLETGATVAYLCSPNNPDGLVLLKQEVQDLVLSNASVLFIVDEAYFEFGGDNCAPLVRRCKNVVVTRTFSKAFGLASLRIGYLVAHPSLVSELERINNPKACSHLIRHMALTALTTALPAYKEQVAEINTAKNGFSNCVRTLIGTGEIRQVVRGRGGNFVLIEVTDCDFAKEKLKHEGLNVRVRHTAKSNGGLLRVSIGGFSHMRSAFLTLSRSLSRARATAAICMYTHAEHLSCEAEEMLKKLTRTALPLYNLRFPDCGGADLQAYGAEIVFPSTFCELVENADASQIFFCDVSTSAYFENIMTVALAARGNFIMIDDTTEHLSCEVLSNNEGYYLRKPREGPASQAFRSAYAGMTSLALKNAAAIAPDFTGDILKTIDDSDIKMRVCSTLERSSLRP